MAVKRSKPLPEFGNQAFLDEQILSLLNEIGERALKVAVATHEFDNQTHNLEDSYAFATYKNGTMQGEPVLLNPQATSPSGGKFGINEARDFLSSESPRGTWSLVVVAGMKYASFVQFYYGLDVLQESEMTADSLASVLLKDIQWVSRKQN